MFICVKAFWCQVYVNSAFVAIHHPKYSKEMKATALKKDINFMWASFAKNALPRHTEFWCMRVLMMYDHLDMCGHFSWLHLIMCLSTNLCIYNPLQGLNKQTPCHLILLSWLIYQGFFHNLHTRYGSQLDWKLCKYICWYLNAWLAIINNTHDA